MNNKLHIVSNAHLDPIWQWEWEEGAAAALSTFKAAADLADEFDYIFCHNEVTLYKYIEEYAPALTAVKINVDEIEILSSRRREGQTETAEQTMQRMEHVEQDDDLPF